MKWAVLAHAGIWGHIEGIWVGVWKRKLQTGSWRTPAWSVWRSIGGGGRTVSILHYNLLWSCTWAFSQPGFLSSPIDPAADSQMGKHDSAPRTAVQLRALWKQACQTSYSIPKSTKDINVVRRPVGQGSAQEPGDLTLVITTLTIRWERGYCT